ncbi:AbrB/MazE/SpoVT family DNA-binding domain-containing protein [Bacillus carboniphilus]|uniref:AbrB/MazE/SpoVT family DNA-binding domain-containing protein n=1 Tax=Bacillus carboniphilus TaxID=86663 RepID=A0ABY9JQM1_9BACI|nr:AbrB/MazE/SpoVT family DNA-binding domain-containing protein [Bacillus carboniphilus]WLR41707.1 AbrB/MazE/SpoVT family DNA-binding domain-containing protein [Bacillus carboniphilus]
MDTSFMSRKMDRLGRVTLPSGIRKRLDIKLNDPLEIFIDEDSIVLKKYDEPPDSCIVTGEKSNYLFDLCNGQLSVSTEGIDYLKKEIERIENTLIYKAFKEEKEKGNT